jgi:cysteine synthase
VVITPTAVEPDDPRSYYQVADKFARETPNAILANQYHNPDNPLTHEMTTGPELWDQTDGHITDVIIGMGTGGTITGVGRYLKSKNPNIQIVGIDIEGSILTEIWQNKGKIPEGRIRRHTRWKGSAKTFCRPRWTSQLWIGSSGRGIVNRSLWARQLVRLEGIFAVVHQVPHWRAPSSIAAD